MSPASACSACVRAFACVCVSGPVQGSSGGVRHRLRPWSSARSPSPASAGSACVRVFGLHPRLWSVVVRGRPRARHRPASACSPDEFHSFQDDERIGEEDAAPNSESLFSLSTALGSRHPCTASSVLAPLRKGGGAPSPSHPQQNAPAGPREDNHPPPRTRAQEQLSRSAPLRLGGPSPTRWGEREEFHRHGVSFPRC